MNDVSQRPPPAWSAVFSMTLGVFGLVTAEFLPVSLLTPMAADLAITEGMAGQAVTATAAVALVTSLLITAATRRIDRRYVLLAFSGLLVISNLLVAYAPNMPSLLLGRVLLGFGLANFLGTFLGGFMLERNMRLTQIVMPATMGILGLGLAGVGGVPLLDAMMIALWGMAFGTVPVAWSTWLTRTVPDEAESAGGLLVAAIQFAIASGAAVGGLIFDAGGAIGVFMVSGSVLLLAALLILFGIKAQTAAAT